MLDVLAEMEASNWCSRLFLKSHPLDQLEAMDSDMNVKNLHMMMQPGRKNITVDKHNEKPEGESKQLYDIARHKIRNKKKEQEMETDWRTKRQPAKERH